ncbi:MAG: xylulokinase [Anaerolineae bacterium]
MPRPAVIGLDIGTTSAKAVLFDLTGAALATAQQVIGLSTPRPGWAEQDPAELWAAVQSVLRQVAMQAGGAGVRVAAVSLASQCGSLLPARADGTPLSPIITWIDSRATGVVARWQADGTAETIRRVSGWHPQPGLGLAIAAWLRETQPATFAAAEHYFSANDYILHCLSGQKITDVSCANELLLMDVASGQWSAELCALAGIRPEQLSAPDWSGVAVGPVTPAVSKATGLPPDTLVVNSGHDHCCEALALGITEPGKLLLTCGTAWVITGVADSPSLAALPAAMDLNFHVLPNRWTVSQFLGALGPTVEWWLTHGLQSPDAAAPLPRAELYAAFDRLVGQSAPGSNGLLFAPPGAAGRTAGGFAGLRLDHTRADLSRAVLEGAAFELRSALETLRAAGQPAAHLWLLGGATRSPHWPQILADVTGVPLTTTRYAHWAALGAAILAGAGAGLLAAESAHTQFTPPTRTIEPNRALAGLYADSFARYRTLA